VKNGFLPMLAAGLIGGGVTAAALLGTGAARERVTRTVVEGSSLESLASPAGARAGKCMMPGQFWPLYES